MGVFIDARSSESQGRPGQKRKETSHERNQRRKKAKQKARCDTRTEIMPKARTGEVVSISNPNTSTTTLNVYCGPCPGDLVLPNGLVMRESHNLRPGVKYVIGSESSTFAWLG